MTHLKLLLALALLSCAARLPAAETDSLLPVDQAFSLQRQVLPDGQVNLRWNIAPGYYLYRHRTRVTAPEGRLDLPEGEHHDDPYFGPVQTYRGQLQAQWHPVQRGAATLDLQYQGCADAGVCYPPQRRQVALQGAADWTIVRGAATTTAAADASATSTGPAATPVVTASAGKEAAPADRPGSQLDATFWLAIGLALLGGLVLNLMPCVLPILSLKVLSLANSGASPGRARAHALSYTGGVLVSFALAGIAVLSLRAFGHGVGWGAQLQQPLVVAGLAYLMVALGLGLSGVYTPSGAFAGAGQGLASKPGLAGDFFTGVLACVVASPCVAPFMGTALAYAFVAPPTLALLVFLALGLGLALPFLLVGIVPAFARFLPRPGAWMDTLKQVLAYPLYLTAAWLLWVLGKQRGVDALVLVLGGSIMLAAGLWWFERHRWQGRTTFAVSGLLVAVAALAPLWIVAYSQPANTSRVVSDDAYTPQRLQQLRDERRTVFVNMTADWCVTCKANEHAVLDTSAFKTLLQQTGTVALRGDWTSGDPAITRFLDEHGAVGVPLYVVYRPGQPPRVLSGLLNQDRLASALR
ncbi:protein-disulfide reductase DsbD [Pseudoxanthomonas sp.]|uniref:protein-disulfide reductase DsbD family protein n=1 Tax=Pseudoxanthomonas sp. TaxID=1871049 RepID=UPI00260E715A|nr:protein-disulfide reductase DsbD [Pseudoxanthomonas sp.]WDS37007.1 MAG: protein-disulfide reductase DsbD [Pseudoxanthomonas sp.]